MKPEEKTKEYKIVVIGDSNVGKTAIIHQFLFNTFSKDHAPTLGVKNQFKYVEVNGNKIKMDIWDTAGDEFQQNNVRNFFAGAHAVIIVYSIESVETFKSVETHISNVEL